MSVQSTDPEILKRVLAAEPVLGRKPQTYWSMAVQSLRKDRLTMTAIIVVTFLGILAIFAPQISSALVGVGPNDTNPDNAFAQPYVVPYIQWRLGTDTQTAPLMLGESGGVPNWLGTDQLGRDQLVRLLYGGRVSLTIAFMAAFISLVIGVAVGLVSGYFGGLIDDVTIWFINTVSSIPTIYILIIITAIFKPNPMTLTLFLGFLGWLGTARFMRGNVFRVREMDYTLAARAIGAKNSRIMIQHVLPNSVPVIIVITAISAGTLILTESALSFLGLGVQAPTATWGSMLNRAQNLFFLRDPETGAYLALHMLIPAGVMITVTVLCLYLIGDGLRDALDPTLKNSG